MLQDAHPGPKAWDFKPTFEFRTRYERRIDRDFLGSANDNRTDGLFRTRVGFVASDGKNNKLTFQYQHGYDNYRIGSGDFTVRNSDVPIFNLETKFSGWTLVLGRQYYTLGDGRLFSSLGSYGNLGRTFQGARLRNKMWEFAAFGEAVNTPSNQELYTGIASVRTSLGLTSVIYKEDNRTADTTQLTTLNHLWKAKADRLDFTLEGSLQGGQNNGKDQEAFGIVGNVGFRPDKQVRVFVEGALASGGTGATSRTFDPIYPNAPLPYGMRAQVGFRNLKELSFGATWTPRKDLKIDGYLTFVNLFDRKDGWYSLAGGLNKRPGGSFIDPTGASGSNVGDFVQVEATWDVTKHDTIGAGIGVFRPGSFVDRQLGGAAKSQTWGYLQYRYRF